MSKNQTTELKRECDDLYRKNEQNERVIATLTADRDKLRDQVAEQAEKITKAAVRIEEAQNQIAKLRAELIAARQPVTAAEAIDATA